MSDNRTRRQRVLVGIPSLQGQVTTHLMEFVWMLQALGASGELPFDFQLRVVPFAGPVEYARNRMVGAFLRESTADRLWMIDDDMLPTRSSLAMLAVDADIVTGRAFIWRHQDGGVPGFFVGAFEALPGDPVRFASIRMDGSSGVVREVDAAGAACLLVRRGVLEDSRMWLSTRYTGPDGAERDLAVEDYGNPYAPPLFRSLRKPNGEVYWGEDMDFVWRARTLGYSVRVHLGAVFGHAKTIDLEQVAALFADKLGDK